MSRFTDPNYVPLTRRDIELDTYRSMEKVPEPQDGPAGDCETRIDQLERELAGRKRHATKLGLHMGRTTHLLHKSEMRYARLVAYNEQLLARIEELQRLAPEATA